MIKPKQAWSWSKNAKTQFDLIAIIVYLELLLGAGCAHPKTGGNTYIETRVPFKKRTLFWWIWVM